MHWLTHSFTHIHPFIFLSLQRSLSLSFPFSLALTLAHSVTHQLNHSLTHALACSLRSVTRSLTNTHSRSLSVALSLFPSVLESPCPTLIQTRTKTPEHITICTRLTQVHTTLVKLTKTISATSPTCHLGLPRAPLYGLSLCLFASVPLARCMHICLVLSLFLFFFQCLGTWNFMFACASCQQHCKFHAKGSEAQKMYNISKVHRVYARKTE